jgi:hypothetical protein
MEFGPFAQGLGSSLATSLFNGSLLGTTDRSNGTSASRFDTSQLPLLNQQLGQTDIASAKLAELIRALSGQRLQQLQGNLDQQLNAVQGIGLQANRDINQRYNSQQGNVGQSLANRGLYNSTIAPGMSALVERERNAALGQERDRQRQYLGGIYGQRASALDQVNAQQNQSLGQLGMNDYQLRAMIPQQIASSRITSNNNVTKKGGIFSSLFG